ncbi:MAG: endonuclease III [Clostridiales bacterium]|jgi:endonuclease-3|nr:endonuclease III [Clostridiales bacterium]
MDGQTFKEIIDALDRRFPEAKCELNYSTPFELLVAVILSAQCTDKRVNAATKEMFAKYNTPEAIAGMDDALLERYLYPLGFYRSKTKSLKAAAKKIIDDYGGRVPDGLAELTAIPGVGRKTASVILSEAFGKNAFAVDTHVLRVCRRLGITDGQNTDPYAAELAVSAIIDADRMGRAHILMVFFGRYVCTARNPECEKCPITDKCQFVKTKNHAYKEQ